MNDDKFQRVLMWISGFLIGAVGMLLFLKVMGQLS